MFGRLLERHAHDVACISKLACAITGEQMHKVLDRDFPLEGNTSAAGRVRAHAVRCARLSLVGSTIKLLAAGRLIVPHFRRRPIDRDFAACRRPEIIGIAPALVETMGW